MLDLKEYRGQNKERDRRYKQPFLKRVRSTLFDPDRVTQILLTGFTGMLIVVGVLQWCTFKSTENVLQATNDLTTTVQRPYVFLDEIKIDYSAAPVPMVSARWKNFGQTPAIISSVRYNLFIVRNAYAAPITFSLTNSAPLTQSWTVAGNSLSQKFTFAIARRLGETPQDNVPRQANLLGWYRYSDMFGSSYLQCFHFVLTVPAIRPASPDEIKLAVEWPPLDLGSAYGCIGGGYKEGGHSRVGPTPPKDFPKMRHEP